MVCCGTPNLSNDKFSTFSDACYTGNMERIRDLMRKSIHPDRIVNEIASDGYTPLHRAAQKGSVDVINYLIENRADPCIASRNGETALHIAAFHRKRAAVRELLKTPLRSLIDQQDSVHSMTALHMAVYRGVPPIAEYLLEAGANASIKDKYGNNVVELAQFWVNQAKSGNNAFVLRHEKTLETLRKFISDIETTPSTAVTSASPEAIRS